MKKLGLLLLVGVMVGCAAEPEKPATNTTPEKKTQQSTKGMTAEPREPA